MEGCTWKITSKSNSVTLKTYTVSQGQSRKINIIRPEPLLATLNRVRWKINSKSKSTTYESRNQHQSRFFSLSFPYFGVLSKSHQSKSWSQVILYLNIIQTPIQICVRMFLALLRTNEKKLARKVKSPWITHNRERGLVTRVPLIRSNWNFH